MSRSRNPQCSKHLPLVFNTNRRVQLTKDSTNTWDIPYDSNGAKVRVVFKRRGKKRLRAKGKREIQII